MYNSCEKKWPISPSLPKRNPWWLVRVDNNIREYFTYHYGFADNTIMLKLFSTEINYDESRLSYYRRLIRRDTRESNLPTYKHGYKVAY